MRNLKRKRYLLLSLLVAAAIFVGSIQLVSARIANPVGNLPDGGALLPTGQVITPAAPQARLLQSLTLVDAQMIILPQVKP